ncbi:hypothetical protein CYMTET_24437 [Cymbomonas tetramitiformis]|uniref:Uncharacterized protein n=1 Tax=Cymbomonas tetramitiformis TaxID=36881 RepID=A0AAE0L098_9CHLO|nr:hypothetical protein CYMTET_24437 [Cymbomonas tetramitiformis]
MSTLLPVFCGAGHLKVKQSFILLPAKREEQLVEIDFLSLENKRMKWGQLVLRERHYSKGEVVLVIVAILPRQEGQHLLVCGDTETSRGNALEIAFPRDSNFLMSDSTATAGLCTGNSTIQVFYSREGRIRVACRPGDCESDGLDVGFHLCFKGLDFSLMNAAPRAPKESRRNGTIFT